MPEVIVAVFNTAVDADEAVRALEANNLPSSAIRRYRRDDPSIPGRPETTQEQGVHYQSQTAPADTRASGGFWSWLTGEDRGDWRDPNYADTDDQYYSRSIEAGNTVVAVHVDQADSERVMRLLADQNPIGLEDTGAEGRTTTPTTTGDRTAHGDHGRTKVGFRGTADGCRARPARRNHPVGRGAGSGRQGTGRATCSRAPLCRRTPGRAAGQFAR